MRRIESALEIVSPVIGILIVLLFNYLFPAVIKTKGDLVFLIGVSLTVYGVSLAVVSRSQAKHLRELPRLAGSLRAALEELRKQSDAEIILPPEVCLQWEQAVKSSVHVLTHDLSWNIDEAGMPQLMFDTITFNLRRGITYEYVVIDASEGTKQNLNLLRGRLKEKLHKEPDSIDNFRVMFVQSSPLLFSFALFDMNMPGRAHHGFILAHTLDKPMSIPMNLATFKRARDVFNEIVSISKPTKRQTRSNR